MLSLGQNLPLESFQISLVTIFFTDCPNLSQNSAAFRNLNLFLKT